MEAQGLERALIDGHTSLNQKRCLSLVSFRRCLLNRCGITCNDLIPHLSPRLRGHAAMTAGTTKWSPTPYEELAPLHEHSLAEVAPPIHVPLARHVRLRQALVVAHPLAGQSSVG